MALDTSISTDISFPDFGPSGSPTQAFDREFSEVNKGIEFNNPIPVISPAIPQTTPNGVDINQNLVGNEQTGPSPGAKNLSGGTVDFVKAVNSYMGQADQWAKDQYKYGRTYSYGAGYKNMNFDRYYEHPNFKKLGFSPYRNNEELYNENSTWLDDFRRMGTQWGKLFTTGFGSSLFLVDDDEAAEAMEKGMAIGSSSKEGVGAWITNFGLNSAYTMGIMTEVVLEDLGLAALEIGTAGAATPIVAAELARQSLSIGKAIKGIEKTRDLINSLKNIDNAREIFSASKLGDAAIGAGKFLNPFTRTFDFTANLARGTGSYKELSNLSKTTKGFSNFYKDVREISLAIEEGGMEAAMASNTYHQQLIDEYYAKNGKMPEGAAAQDIYEKSKSVRASTQLWNNAIIFYSNRLTIGKLLDGFPAVSLLAKGIEDTSTKYITKAATKDVLEKGLLEVSEKSLGRKTTEFLLKSPYVPWSKPYIVGNISEALQENAQEAIQKGVIAYHDKIDKDPSQAGFWQGVSHMGAAIGTQFSGEGLNTFMSGFLMGSLAGGTQGLVMKGYQGIRSLDPLYKQEIEQAKENATKREDAIVDSVNDIAKNAMNIGQDNANTAAAARSYASEMDSAVEEGNEYKFNDSKDNLAGEKFYTLAATGKMKLLTNNFKDMLKATDQELAEAYNQNPEDGPKVRKRLETLIERANNFQKLYDKASKEFANPNDPSVADPKKNPELYQRINRKYTAWNEAVKSIVISTEAASRVSGRIASIANELSSVSPWLETRRAGVVNNTAGIDEAMSLIDNSQRKDMVRTLLLEAETLEKGTEEEKEEATIKRQIAETLREWGIVTNNFNIELLSEKRNLTPEQKEAKANLMKIREGAVIKIEGSEEEYKVERVIGDQVVTKNKEGKTAYISRNKAQIVRESTLEKKGAAENTLDEAIEMMYDTYTKYLQLVAKQKGGTIIDKEGDAAFKKIRDFYMLERDSQDLTKAINLLSNPLYFNRLYQAEQAVQEKREKEKDLRIREAFTAYEKLLKDNAFLNELYDLGLWIFPEQVDEFKKDPRSVTYFDKVNKQVVEPTSETYKKIEVILDKYFPVEKKEEEVKVEEKETEVKVEEEKKPKVTQRVTPNITIEQLNKIPELKTILIKLYKNQYVRESKGLTDEEILNTPKFKNFIKTSGTALDQIAKYNLSSEPVVAKEEEVDIVIPDELTEDNWKELIDKAVSERELNKIVQQIDNVNQMTGGLMLAINKKQEALQKAPVTPAPEAAPVSTDGIESKIKIEPIHQEILNLLPDYSNVKISLENDKGGLGYVGDFQQREEDNSKNTRVSTTIKYSGVPSSEIYTHELLHYFTIPALILYKQGNRNENVKQYVEALDKLYTKAKSKGYTSINGVSVHDNLNEFAVNITNEKSIEQLKKLGLYNELMNVTKNYLNSLQQPTVSTDGKPKVVKVYHHTNVAPQDFDFGSFQRGKQQVSQFGDGLNASSTTTPFLVQRYGDPIEGEIDDSDFVVIDANKSEKELYEELKAKGYKFNNPDTGSYIGNDPAKQYDGAEKANVQPAIISLFNDFQKSNPQVKGVKVINHIIGNQKVDPFYVIYDAKSFYGPGSLSKTQSSVSTDAKADIEKEKASITNSEFTELKRLAKFFLENPKEPTVSGSVVTRYPALFKALTEIEKKIKGLEEQIKTTYRFMGDTDSYAATVRAEKDIKMYEEDLKKLKEELASLEPKPEVKPEEAEAISERTYYQGAETLDEREFNYFTTQKEEAKDYGENVREVRVEPTNPLVYYENREVVDEFNNQNTGQVAEEFKGKFIYISPGAGKTTLAETNENIVDADQLIIEEINKAYPDFTREADETDQEFINRFTKVYRTKRVAINNAVRTRVEALLIEGKTVLTGTLAFANDVDLAFTLKASDPKLLKRFSSIKEIEEFLAREQETFDKAEKEISILDKSVEKKFTTAVKFDILDNSPEGLATQNAFFKFAKSKGYDAIDFSIKGSKENQYLVSLTNDIVKPATEKKAEVKVEEKVEAKPTGKQRVVVTPDLLSKVDDISSIDELNEFFGDLYDNQEAKEKYGLLNASNVVIKKLHNEFKKRFYKKKDFRTALKGTVGLLTTGQKFVIISKTKDSLKYRILDASNLPVGEEQTMGKEDFKNNVDIIYKDGMELEEDLFAPVATENKITSNENIEGTSSVLTKEKIEEALNKAQTLSKEERLKKLKDNLGCKK